jgi:uncharacterized Tic20 family protein
MLSRQAVPEECEQMADEFNRDESDRVSRLSSIEADSDSAVEADAVVREYEERYSDPPKRKSKPHDMPRSYSTMRVSDEERLWAALAHGSVWITFALFFTTAGVGVPLSVFIPVMIYFLFRKKSDYVTFHALQAFVLQLVGTVGALALLVIGGIIWVIGLIVSLVLIVVIVGIVIAPLWGLVGIALLVVVVLMPFAMLLLGTIAMIETYNRRDYRYPYIARWVDRQLAGGLLNAL